MMTHFSPLQYATVAFVIVILCIAQAQAFKEGDYIDSQRRSRLGNEVPTDWHSFLSSQLPRYKVDRDVLWQMLDSEEELAALNQKEYKIQLAFERGLFQTPWVTLYSQNPLLVLSRLYIVFIYSDSVIVDFKAYPEYTTVSELSKNGGHIVFSYRWEEFGEHDPNAAYAYIFGAPLLLAGYFAFKILSSPSHGKLGRDLQA